MKHFLITLLIVLTSISAKSQVGIGDIAFIGINEDLPVDGFAIIILKAIPGSAIIYFTDQGISTPTSWAGNTEDHWKFTAPPNGIPCGTIISFTENTTDILTITGVSGATIVHQSGTGLFNLSGGDQMIAYTGAASSPASATFISGITTDDGNGSPTCLDPITGWSAEGGCVGTSVNRSIIPPGLTNGVHCISVYPALGTELDNSKYIGTLTGNSNDIRAAINDLSNWDGNDLTNYDISPSGYPPANIICVALPVELIDFDVENEKNNYINLTWATATEVNNDYFEIQNSVDGQQWQLVGKVEGMGNTTNIQNYTFKDTKPYFGTSYYRLKQVDFDGQLSYSPIKSISLDKFNSRKYFQIFPNPVSHQLNINGAFPDDVQVQIFNMQGLKTDGLILNKDRSNIRVDVSNLADGLYLLQVQGENFRFMKAKV